MSANDTRERIIESARLLVQDASYEGFSFRDIAEQVGIRKASIYYHFETKEALAVAMLEQATTGFGQWAHYREQEAPEQRLRAYCFDFYRDRLKAGEKLCPGGAFTAAWPHLGERVRWAVKRLFDAQHVFVLQALKEAYAAGADGMEGDLGEVATWFIASIQGAIVVARAQDDVGIFERLCECTLRQLALQK